MTAKTSMPNSIAARYKSPIHKVLSLLEKGRDNWKAKYSELKQLNKYLLNKLRRIEQSKEVWKQRAIEAERVLDEIKAAQKKAHPDPVDEEKKISA
jgi:hypothetical protein